MKIIKAAYELLTIRVNAILPAIVFTIFFLMFNVWYWESNYNILYFCIISAGVLFLFDIKKEDQLDRFLPIKNIVLIEYLSLYIKILPALILLIIFSKVNIQNIGAYMGAVSTLNILAVLKFSAEFELTIAILVTIVMGQIPFMYNLINYVNTEMVILIGLLSILVTFYAGYKMVKKNYNVKNYT